MHGLSCARDACRMSAPCMLLCCVFFFFLWRWEGLFGLREIFDEFKLHVGCMLVELTWRTVEA